MNPLRWHINIVNLTKLSSLTAVEVVIVTNFHLKLKYKVCPNDICFSRKYNTTSMEDVSTGGLEKIKNI